MVLGAHDEPGFLVLVVVERAGLVEQLEEHGLRRVFGVGGAAQVRIAQAVDRLRMAVKHRGYVELVRQGCFLSESNTTGTRIMSGWDAMYPV